MQKTSSRVSCAPVLVRSSGVEVLAGLRFVSYCFLVLVLEFALTSFYF